MTREEAKIEIEEEFKEFLHGTGLEDEAQLAKEMDKNPDLKRVVEANRMAIKALEQEPREDATLKDIFCMGCEYKEQEPCEDCISRQAVLNTLDKMDDALDEDRTVEIYKMLLTECVTVLPSVTPKQKTGNWIPVSERLPKNDEDVLVCFPQGGMAVAYYHIDDTHYPTQYEDLNETGWFNEEDDAFYFEPIAWMPLPEPYKAESEGE